MTRHDISDAAVARATAAGLHAGQIELRAHTARYLSGQDAIELQTIDNGGFLIPRRLIGELRDTTPDQLATLELWPDGSVLALDDLDIHMSVNGLIAAVLPHLVPERVVASLFAARGGAARSPAKTATSRANGKKGGRPPKNRSKPAA